jgi:spermidine synthase
MRCGSGLGWRDGVVGLAFFASGAAGLVYELCWIREASAIFGGTTLAASSVLAVFFAGLALGSALFGRIAERLVRPLRAFVALELAVAALAVLTPLAFAAAAPLFGSLYRATAPGSLALFAGRLALVAAILLPPTLLMGGTLPLLCREYVRRDARVAGPVGWLYGINTLGALAGCLLCGLWWLPAFGLARSLQLAAGLGVAAAVGVALALRGRRSRVEPQRSSEGTGARRLAQEQTRPRLVAALVFVTGFAAVGGQVMWIRFLALVLPNGVHATTFTLAAVLAGIAAGGVLAAAVGDRLRRPLSAFAALQLAWAVAVVFALHLPVATLRELARPLGAADPGLAFLAGFGPCALLALPALLSATGLPLAVRIAGAQARGASRRVGVLFALNTLGGIAGSLVVGFYALPRLGLEPVLAGLSGVSLLAGAIAAGWAAGREVRTRAVAAVAVACAVGTWMVLPRWLGTALPDDHLLDPGDELVALREGREGNVAVIRHAGQLTLEIDRWWQGQRAANHQRVAAHLPALLHGAPRRALVVGLGAGQTPSRLLLHESLERLDCVEIEPAVIEVVRDHFEGAAWLDDPRVRLFAEDGRAFVAHGEGRYDLISLELGQVFRPAVAPFYHQDFYARAAARLAPGGLLSQFVPLAFFAPAELRRAIASFLAVFPASSLWYNSSELLLIGAREPLAAIDAGRLLRALARPAIRADLDFSHWGGADRALHRPEVLLGGFLLGPPELHELAAGAAPFRNDRPELAYLTSAWAPDPAREIASAELLARHLTPVEQLPGALVPSLLALGALEVDALREVQALDAAALIADARLRELDAAGADGRLDALEEHLRRVHPRNPEHARLNRTLGELSLRRRSYDEAIGFLDAALAAKPEDGLALKAKAMALHFSIRVRESIPLYRAALAQRPHDAELLNGLGSAYAERRVWHAARRYFERAAALGDATARRNLERLVRLESGS